MPTETPPPDPTPEGVAVGAATKASGRSIRSLATEAGISDTRWRHIVNGWQRAPDGRAVAVKAPARTLASIAHVLHMTPEQLTDVGRPDAADVLTELRNRPAEREPRAAGGSCVYLVVHEHGGVAGAFLDELAARRIAEQTGGVVAVLPVIADYRDAPT